MTSTDDAKKETLVVWAWDKNFNIKAVNAAKKVFQDSHPNVEIEVVTMTQEESISKLNTALAAGDDTGLPDILLIEDYRIQKYLTEYEETFADLSDIADIDDFAAYKTSVSQRNGRLYGIPFDSGVAVLFYRIDIMEAAGYTQEDMDSLTWEQYIEMGKVVKEKTGADMLALIPSDLGQIRMMLQSAGSWYTDKNGNVDIKENQALKDAIVIYKNLFETGISKQTADWNQFAAAFQNGEVASVPMGYWLAASIMEAEEQEGTWAVAAFPRMGQNPNSVNASSIGGGGWYVFKNTGNTALAKQFLKETFASNQSLLRELTEEINLISTLKTIPITEHSLTNLKFYNGESIGTQLANWQNQIPMVNYGYYTYEIESFMIEALQRILEGEEMEKVLEETHNKIVETMK